MSVQDAAAQVALTAALTRGTLPITSACNFACVFCSNQQNPPEVRTYRLPHRPLAAVRADIDLLPRSGRIVVGEAATRIDEGEPFLHPDVGAILTEVRAARPRAELVVTTNGSLLDERRIAFLATLAPLSVNLSLNLVTPAARQRWLGDGQPTIAPAAARLLTRAGVPWTGSLVALPHLTGWDELDRTVRFLAEAGAQTARLFLPGFTQYARPEMVFDPEALWATLRQFGRRVSADTWLPVTVEPPRCETLTAEVVGVIRGSAAARAGLRPGDVITAVGPDAAQPRCRVACHRLLTTCRGPFAVAIERQGQPMSLRLGPAAMPAVASASDSAVNAVRPSAHGIVLDFDIEPRQVEAAAALIKRARGETLILTGALAAPLVEMALAQELADTDAAWRVAAVENRFFGGSIMAAGLLTVTDLIDAGVEATAASHPALILIPALPFDDRGRDLTGRSYMDIADALGVPVELVR